MSVLALRNYVSEEDETRPSSLTDLLHVPEEDRQATIRELRRRGDALIAALDALRRDARAGGGDLESVLRDIRREERNLAASVREIARHLQAMRKEVQEEQEVRRLWDRQWSRSDLRFAEEALGVDQAVLAAYLDCRKELEALRKQRLEEYASEWLAYLSKLKERPEYAALAPQIEEFWRWISEKLWAPEATPTDDGFLLIWDRDEHHLQVELFQDGSYDWFYRNRDSDTVSYEEGLPFGRWTERFKAAISTLRGS